MTCLTPVPGLGNDDIFGVPVDQSGSVDFYDPVDVARSFHENPMLFA